VSPFSGARLPGKPARRTSVPKQSRGWPRDTPTEARHSALRPGWCGATARLGPKPSPPGDPRIRHPRRPCDPWFLRIPGAASPQPCGLDSTTPSGARLAPHTRALVVHPPARRAPWPRSGSVLGLRRASSPGGPDRRALLPAEVYVLKEKVHAAEALHKPALPLVRVRPKPPAAMGKADE
jgi:hypothetical protein